LPLLLVYREALRRFADAVGDTLGTLLLWHPLGSSPGLLGSRCPDELTSGTLIRDVIDDHVWAKRGRNGQSKAVGVGRG
jgi:hypothetical protein